MYLLLVMTIQYCSDLHLEFESNKTFLKTNPLIPQADVLLLAGDAVPFPFADEHDDFFRFLSKNFQYTYWLPGNHEYYGTDAARKSGTLKEKIKHNVFLVNNAAITHGDVRLLFSTLWANISPANEWTIEKNVSDFHTIRYNGYRFSVPAFNLLHKGCMNFLRSEMQNESGGKTIVVTHHVPTFLNYPPQYKSSSINEAFAVELHDFIDDCKADAWIYGHHHVNTPEFTIGKTRMLTNQLGYVQQGEHRLFDGAKILNI